MKRKTFRGGYCFKGFTGQPDDRLTSFGIPSRVRIPLVHDGGASLVPAVKTGEKVSAGQIIARDDAVLSSPIHATINGKVTGISKKKFRNRTATMAEIESDGTDGYRAVSGSNADWQALAIDTIERLIYESGAAGLDRDGIPTRFRSAPVMPDTIEDIIIHGTGADVYAPSLGVLLKDKNLFNLIEAAKILKKVMPKARIHLAVNAGYPDIVEGLQKLLAGTDGFSVTAVAPKYPQGFDELLVPTVLGRDFPYGYRAVNIGILVLSVQTALHVFEAVTKGKPVIERTVALCGPSWKENPHLKLRIGTTLDQITGRYLSEKYLSGSDVRLVIGGLLTGETAADREVPVPLNAFAIIALPDNKDREFLTFARPGMTRDSFSRSFAACLPGGKKKPHTNQQGEQRPCIQCGYCISVCPVKILPALLYRYARVNTNETLLGHGVFNCIDCNLCSYVCPSKIPLAKTIKTAKGKLVEIGCDHSMCVLPKFNLKGLDDYKGVKSIR